MGKGHRGFSLLEVLITIGIVGLLLSLLMPAIQAAREASRRTHCSSNFHQLGIGLQQYHETNHFLPALAIWAPAGEPLGKGLAPPGTIDRVSLGLVTSNEPDRLYANWLIAILPFIEEQALFQQFDLKRPIGDLVNSNARATELPLLKCPSDGWNGEDNHFQRAGLMNPDAGYARTNVAMNAGTNSRCLMGIDPACTDGFQVKGMNLTTNTTQVWGSGIGGINRQFRFNDFPNGLSRTVALDEIRAGIHPLDRRGVWALGFPGSSGTVAHGIKGNQGPNAGSDSIQGCSEVFGWAPELLANGMPCSRVAGNPQEEISEQATSRSSHADGVNLMMTDGSVHFIANEVDANVWHQMHKRDNQTPFEMPF